MTTAVAARLRLQIPMPGAADSLNVAATAVVCLFECLRRAAKRQVASAALQR